MKYAITTCLLFVSLNLLAQKNYWQQEVKYNISAELNDKENTIAATEKIVYKNNAPAALNFIWFHIWPNAYSNDSTALIQQIKTDSSRKKKLADFTKGHIEDLAFTVNGKAAKTEPNANPQYIDIIKVLLDKPLQPGDSVIIETPFKVKLPSYFSRSGFADGEYMVCQWYPKPAVFDKNGWHEFPYLDMGEFYSEYASFNVNITLPGNYIVGATGTLNTLSELEAYKKAGAKNAADRKGKPALYAGTSDKKTLNYTIDKALDFAWFADKNFVIQYDTIQLESGKVIDAFSYYHNKRNTLWNNSIDYVKSAVKAYSNYIGEYEYPVVQAVEGPKNNASGGMEYPTITLITSPDAKAETLDVVIAHEVGHNWFMAMLGSCERDHAWMDEGLNTYFQFYYEADKYRGNEVFGKNIPADVKKLPLPDFLSAVYTTLYRAIEIEPAMETTALDFKNSEDYGMASYIKPAMWMYMLEQNIGFDKMKECYHNYFKKWKFKHPQAEDLKAAFEETIGTGLDKYFALINKKGKLE